MSVPLPKDEEVEDVNQHLLIFLNCAFYFSYDSVCETNGSGFGVVACMELGVKNSYPRRLVV